MMPYLTMTIGKVLIQRIELDYTDLIGSTDIEHYQQRQAENLKTANAAKIISNHPAPVFYVDRVPSKMNTEDFDYEKD